VSNVFLRALHIALVLAPALAFAQTAHAQQDAGAKTRVVATFSILGDLAAQVAGERAQVSVLVGPGADAHVYSPTPADAKTLAGANLVIMNGLGFEGWIDRLAKSAQSKARVIVASKGVKPLRPGEKGHAHGHGHGHGHAHGAVDPHAWQSVANVKIYVANIRDGLIAADPQGRAAYEANAAAYLGKLDALEAEVKTAVAAIPPARRKIVTTHEAFIAPQGVSTESGASAQDVARIIRLVRQEKAPAVFAESISDPRLSARIAQETGAKLGGALYSDQLSPPGGPAGTYIDMVRHNIRELTRALAD
jgi:zinc/manganese transport system substrate-binding protein